MRGGERRGGCGRGRPRRAWPVVGALCALALAPLAAQRIEDPGLDPFGTDASAPRRVAPPRVVLRALGEFAVPGPLAGSGPRLDGGRVSLALPGATAFLDGEEGGSVRLEPAVAPAESTDDSALSADGRFRARWVPPGRLLLERACRSCRAGWKREWRLRVPGTSLPRPVVTDRRVFYCGGDNLVYAVERRNGHRIWSRDAGGRVAQRLALWEGVPRGATEPQPVQLLLVVPDSPSKLLALDPRSGEPVTSFDLGEDQTLVGAALVLPDGRIVVARQDYESRGAALVLLEVAAAPAAAPQAG